MSRLEILENSLIKKKDEFNKKLQEHFDTVSKSNGQPLNDKRCGASTMRKWDKQSESLRLLENSIKKTENAIEIEKDKIRNVELTNVDIPSKILELVDKGVLTQWRKHPNRFFVVGVDKARIIWDLKTRTLKYQYANRITNKEQYDKFRSVLVDLVESMS